MYSYLKCLRTIRPVEIRLLTDTRRSRLSLSLEKIESIKHQVSRPSKTSECLVSRVLPKESIEPIEIRLSPSVGKVGRVLLSDSRGVTHLARSFLQETVSSVVRRLQTLSVAKSRSSPLVRSKITSGAAGLARAPLSLSRLPDPFPFLFLAGS